MIDNNYYIYFHINPLKNEIFYVGKGKNKRAFEKYRRSEYWLKYVKKYGYIIDIVEENLTEDEAFSKEIDYIKRIGRKDLGSGTLINLTNGGDGCVSPSIDTKNKLSLANMGKRKGSENHSSIYIKYNDIEYECLKDLWNDKFIQYSYSYFTILVKRKKIENLLIISDIKKYDHKNHYRSKKVIYDNNEYKSLNDLREQKFIEISKTSFLRWCKNGKIQIKTF
jgi:hypothetical protein